MRHHYAVTGLLGLMKHLRAQATLLLAGALAMGVLWRAQASGTISTCSEVELRRALVGGGDVVLACDSTITLTNTIIVSKETVLDGTGHTPVLTASSSSNSVRVFLVMPGASLTLRRLSLNNTKLVGATGTNSNSGQPAYGAAIFNDHGFVTLDGCTLTGNSVTGGDGSNGSKLGFDAGSGGLAAGAAIYNSGGQITITNSSFQSNSAAGGAGGTGAAGAILGNGGQGGNGGNSGLASGAAIYNTDQGSITILASHFASNSSTTSSAGTGGFGSGVLGFPGKNGTTGAALGGAIFNESGSISVLNSSFWANGAVGGPGVTGLAATNRDDGGNATDGGSAQGAGLYNLGGQVALTNCTFAANFLTGGPGGVGGIGDTTGLGGPGGDGGDGGNALGAGICTSAKGSTTVVNCTFSDNTAAGGQGGRGGAGGGRDLDGDDGKAGTANGGAVFSQGGSIKLRNSILGNSLSVPNAGGPITDQGFNLSSDVSPAFTAQGSRNKIDPDLGSLVQSGQIWTLTLSSNSPAINAISPADGNGAPYFDQRNAFRVFPYDIGAYEFGGTTTPSPLQVTLVNGQVLLSWPAMNNYQLQSSPTLASTNSWSTVTATPSSSGGLNSLSVAKTNSASFYRLLQP
jgi:hypothetical protein